MLAAVPIGGRAAANARGFNQTIDDNELKKLYVQQDFLKSYHLPDLVKEKKYTATRKKAARAKGAGTK